MVTQPIKRSEHILELSKDHHASLLFCWKIKEGLRRGIELFRIKNYINFFWNCHLKEHFMEEEMLLFNLVNDPLTGQGKQEHLMVMESIGQLNENELNTGESYASFAELLTKHIRFEERVLFPHIETTLSEEQLAMIGELLKNRHTPFHDTFPDEFWLQKKT